MNNYEKLLYKTNRQKRQLRILMAKNKLLKQKLNQLETNIDEAIEYINKYAWQEDIIGDMYTTTGKPIVDRYMQLDWDSCNELLSLLERGKE